MSDVENHKALVATGDLNWRERCTRALLGVGWDVHTASEGEQVLDLLRRHRYDFVVVDESFSDMGLVEFSMNVRDIAPNRPMTLIGGSNVARLQRVCRHCNIYFAGPREEVLDVIRQAMPQRAVAPSAPSAPGGILYPAPAATASGELFKQDSPGL